MTEKTYVTDRSARQLAADLEMWLEDQAYKTQVLESANAITIQAKSDADWVQRNGVALQVVMRQRQDGLHVDVGTSKWATHAVGGVVAAIFFWPLMALPAYAAFKQIEIIDGTWGWIEEYLAAEGEEVEVAPEPLLPIEEVDLEAEMASAPAPRPMACPACGQPVSASANFCANCGAKLRARCEQCGADLDAGASYCESCGARVGGPEDASLEGSDV